MKMSGRYLDMKTIFVIMTYINIVLCPFSSSPSTMTVAVGEKFTLQCRHTTAAGIRWKINGTYFNGQSISSYINATPRGRGALHKLHVTRISTLLNGTAIQCKTAGSGEDSSPALIWIQGRLEGVVNLTRNSNTLSFKAPFSLNLTNADPDIAYCVNVYNVTCGGRELLISDCNVAETSYTSDVIAPDGYIYEYIVTPRSNVEGTQNGTSKSVTEQFMDLQLSTMGLTFNFNDNTEVNDSTERLEVKTMIHLNQEQKEIFNLVNAASYSLLLNPLDGVGGDSILESTTAVRNGSSVILKVSLPFRRLWNYTVLANDCEEHSLLETNELSTHDVQNISVTSPQPGEVRVTSDFIDGSTATGLLTIIVISTSEIFYHLIERGSDELHIEGAIQGVVGGEHSISFFVVEKSGLPFSRTASTPKAVSVENSNDVKQSFNTEYSVTPTSSDTCTGVFVTCTFLDSSATDCVAVVHQRISQLSSSGLMNIESSHKFTRSGGTASGCIEGVNMEDYQVGVVGGAIIESTTSETETNPSTSSHLSNVTIAIVGVFAALVAAVLFSILVVILLILINIRRRSKNRAIYTKPTPLSPVPNPYEMVETEPGESTRLIRVVSNGAPSDESAHGHDGTPPTTAPPAIPTSEKETFPPALPPPRTEKDPTTVAYTVMDVLKSAKALPPSVEGEKVIYHEVERSQKSQGQHYTLITDLRSRTSDDLHKTANVYSEIKLQDPSSGQVAATEKKNSQEQCLQAEEGPLSSPSVIPFTLEHILPELMDVASKWQALGESLSLDEDCLDEIFTNNETDEACLHDMLEHYMMRSDLKHSWEEIEAAKKKVEEMDEKTEKESESTSQRSPVKEGLVAGEPRNPDRQPSPISNDHNLGESDPTYAQPVLPGSAVVQAQSDVDHKSASDGLGGPTYAQPVLPTSSALTSPPPVSEPVVYDDVKGFKNTEGQQYAMLGELVTSVRIQYDITKTDSDYSEIQPHSLGQPAAVYGKQDISSDEHSASAEESFVHQENPTHSTPARNSIAGRESPGCSLSVIKPPTKGRDKSKLTPHRQLGFNGKYDETVINGDSGYQSRLESSNLQPGDGDDM